MVDWKNSGSRIPLRTKLAGGAVALLALGAAAGASVVSHMRPPVEMAPALPTAIAKLAQTSGIVTVKGKIAEVYGDRFIMQDGSGRLLIDAGPGGSDALRAGGALMVQGRYKNGQFRASYLVDSQGHITDVGAPPPQHGPRHDGPPSPGPGPTPPPPGGIGVPAPPPPTSGVVSAASGPKNSQLPDAGSARQ